MVAGYVCGLYAWSVADWARLTRATWVRICVNAAHNHGQVLDVETGDAFPWEAPDWVARRRLDFANPTVYVNRSNWAPTRTEFELRGLPEPPWWLSTLDNSQPWVPGVVAIQTQGQALTGGHYDLSIVADVWPGVDGPARTLPAMPALVRGGATHADAHGTGSIYLLEGNRKRYLPAPPPPLDNFRWVDQLAAAYNLAGGDAHHVVDIDWQLLDLFPEDSGPAGLPTHLVATLDGHLT